MRLLLFPNNLTKIVFQIVCLFLDIRNLKMPSKKLSIAIVCSSNQNRSMEAHSFLSKKGFLVKSFGVGTTVKLPGPSSDRPNIYDFSVTYDEMYKDLFNRDPHLYTQNGILHMLDRNRRIKSKPEQFQKLVRSGASHYVINC